MSKYLVLLVAIGAAAAIQKVPVTVYYEPLCPDSQTFFTKQLTPTWRDLREYIELQLVPFGKAKTSFANASLALTQSSQGLTWICSHGDNECLGHKFQACIINSEPRISENDQVILIDCLMTNGKKEEEYSMTVKTCAEKSPAINQESLKTCATGDRGNDLFWRNGKETLKLTPPLGFVPTIVFNRVYNQADNDMAQKSFRSALCKHINESPKPKMCESSNGVRTTTTGLMTLISAGLIFRLL